MALTTDIRDREFNKFRDGGGTLTRVAVDVEKFIGTFNWDSFTIAYPTSTQEVYTYTKSAVLTATVTLNYSNSSKSVLTSGTRVIV